MFTCNKLICLLVINRRNRFTCIKQINSLAGIEGIVTLENLDISDTHIVTDSVLCLTRLPLLSHISLTGTQEVNGDQALYYLKGNN